MLKLKKSLSNPIHNKVLETVGLGIEPISAGKIENKLSVKDNRNSDVYRVIHELAGIHTRNIYLTSWNDIRSKYDEEGFKLDFLRKLSKLFRTYLSYIEKTNQEIESEKRINTLNDGWRKSTFTIWEDENHNYYCLDILNSSSVLNKSNPENYRERLMTRDNIQLSFEFDFERGKGYGRLKTWLASQGIPLNITFDENNKEFKIYVNEFDTENRGKINRTRFLEIVQETNGLNFVNINNRILNKSDLKITRDMFGKGIEEFSKGFKGLKTDSRKKYRYYLSLRGLLLYLLGIESRNISKIKKNQSNGEEQRRYRTNRKINEVITALTENEYTKKDYPFLWNYEILDKIEGRYFKVELLKRIAFEAQNMLLREDDDFLRYWVTTQFHAAISKKYGSVLMTIPGAIQPKSRNMNLSIVSKWIDEYDKKMLEYSLLYLQGQEAFIERLLSLKAKSKSSKYSTKI